MTDAQLLDYFRKFNGYACGQFETEQLNRLIQAKEVPTSTWWARLAAGLLIAFGFSKEAHAQKIDERAPVQQQVEHPTIERRAGEDSTLDFEIGGTLVDKRGVPIVHALVEVSEQGIIKGRAFTDFDGNYSITSLERGRYDLRFSYAGEELLVPNVEVQKPKTKVCGALNTNSTMMRGAVIISKDLSRWPLEPAGQKTHRAGDNLPPGY
jgi:hypothetical protein